MQPPPYLRDKVKIALPHLREEISAVSEGGGQPLPRRHWDSKPLWLSRWVQHVQAPPLLEDRESGQGKNLVRLTYCVHLDLTSQRFLPHLPSGTTIRKLRDRAPLVSAGFY